MLPVFQRKAIIDLLSPLAAAHRYELLPDLPRFIHFLTKRLGVSLLNLFFRCFMFIIA